MQVLVRNIPVEVVSFACTWLFSLSRTLSTCNALSLVVVFVIQWDFCTLISKIPMNSSQPALGFMRDIFELGETNRHRISNSFYFSNEAEKSGRENEKQKIKNLNSVGAKSIHFFLRKSFPRRKFSHLILPKVNEDSFFCLVKRIYLYSININAYP